MFNRQVTLGPFKFVETVWLGSAECSWFEAFPKKNYRSAIYRFFFKQQSLVVSFVFSTEVTLLSLRSEMRKGFGFCVKMIIIDVRKYRKNVNVTVMEGTSISF